MLCADRVPIVSAHFRSAMTQTGSPDPRIDLVCITSSCPRQFLQNFGTPSSLPGLTSLNRSGLTAFLGYVRFTPECVAKLSLRPGANRDSVELRGDSRE